jgi:hypothetical protein
LLAAKYFGPFQNSAMVKLMAQVSQVYYHDGYKIAVSSGSSMLQAKLLNCGNTKDLEEITHCAVSQCAVCRVCKQARTNVFINTHFISQSIFITSLHKLHSV